MRWAKVALWIAVSAPVNTEKEHLIDTKHKSRVLILERVNLLSSEQQLKKCVLKVWIGFGM